MNEPKKELRDRPHRPSGPPEPVPPMAEMVTRLDTWLARNRPDFYANLRPGLAEAAWADFESRLGIRLPDAFRVLYRWRDGQNEDLNFRDNRYWMASEDIVRVKELMDGMIDTDFEPGWWERGWVPFLANGAGSHLCVDMGGSEPGRLVEFWNRDWDRPEVAPSFERWLHEFVTSLEQDRWEETEVGFKRVQVRDRGE
ncbi:MAG TPA: SMI1/KNR4 family protein [Gemmata sp.]